MGGGTVAVAIKSGGNHYVTYSLSQLDTEPLVHMRDSMGGKLERKDASKMMAVLDGIACKQHGPSRKKSNIEYVPGPIQLLNECSARALNAATGLAVEVSHWRYCLPYEDDFKVGNNSRREEIGATVNEQSDNMRTLVILGDPLGACSH